MAVDLIFGIALLALGLYLFAQRHARTSLAQERGFGIKSPVLHNLIAGACVVFGIWSIASAFA